MHILLVLRWVQALRFSKRGKDGDATDKLMNNHCKYFLYFANPQSNPITIQLHSREVDPLSNTKVQYSSEKFNIGKRQAKARVWNYYYVKRESDFVSQNMLGVVITLEPADNFNGTYEFVLDVSMGCEIRSKGVIKRAKLRYAVEISVKKSDRKAIDFTKRASTQYGRARKRHYSTGSRSHVGRSSTISLSPTNQGSPLMRPTRSPASNRGSPAIQTIRSSPSNQGSSSLRKASLFTRSQRKSYHY